MIEFHEILLDVNNTELWDIYIRDRKVGFLMKILPYKAQGKAIKGSFHLEILHHKYTLPLTMRKMVMQLVEMQIRSFETDLLLAKIEQSEWNKERLKSFERFKEIVGESQNINEWICAIRQVENERLNIIE
jgi:hypothetical protein